MPLRPDLAAAVADPRTTVVLTRVADGHVRILDGGADTRRAVQGHELVLAAPDVVAAITTDGQGEGFDDARTALLGHDVPGAARLLGAVGFGQWRARTRFCQRCAAPLVPHRDGRALTCDRGHLEFPRIEPAVIMRVVDGDDRILLARQQRWPEGRFSVLAGFVEPGEALEDTVRREVLEEVGVPVTDVAYVKSQPWPFPSSLMLAFTARAEAVPDLVLEEAEIAEAHWSTRDELTAAMADGDVWLPPPLSVAHQLIRGWLGQPLTTWDTRRQ